MLLTILIILLVITTIFSLFYLVPLIHSGIHYEKTEKSKIKTITKLISNSQHLKPNTELQICDLGSGNADILINLARNLKNNSKFTGYEINPILVSISKNKLRKNKLIHLIEIKNKNLWKQNLRKFNIIIIFQFETFMKKLEDKIKKDCKKGTIIISNHWHLPNLKPVKSENDIHMYKL